MPRAARRLRPARRVDGFTRPAEVERGTTVASATRSASKASSLQMWVAAFACAAGICVSASAVSFGKRSQQDSDQEVRRNFQSCSSSGNLWADLTCKKPLLQCQLQAMHGQARCGAPSRDASSLRAFAAGKRRTHAAATCNKSSCTAAAQDTAITSSGQDSTVVTPHTAASSNTPPSTHLHDALERVTSRHAPALVSVLTSFGIAGRGLDSHACSAQRIPTTERFWLPPCATHLTWTPRAQHSGISPEHRCSDAQTGARSTVGGAGVVSSTECGKGDAKPVASGDSAADVHVVAHVARTAAGSGLGADEGSSMRTGAHTKALSAARDSLPSRGTPLLDTRHFALVAALQLLVAYQVAGRACTDAEATRRQLRFAEERAAAAEAQVAHAQQQSGFLQRAITTQAVDLRSQADAGRQLALSAQADAAQQLAAQREMAAQQLAAVQTQLAQAQKHLAAFEHASDAQVRAVSEAHTCACMTKIAPSPHKHTSCSRWCSTSFISSTLCLC